MAVSATIVRRSVFGNRKIVIADLTFSGNYATGGEALAASTLGLRSFDTVILDGVAVAADLATALGAKYNYGTSKIAFYEGGVTAAEGVAFSEKTNGEAYPTGCVVRATAIGH